MIDVLYHLAVSCFMNTMLKIQPNIDYITSKVFFFLRTYIIESQDDSEESHVKYETH